MKKLYLLGLIFTILFFPNCSRKLFYGTYENKIKGLSYEAIKINSDSTFNYEYRVGEWDSENSFGKWSRKNKIIVLNSRYKRDSLPIQVEGHTDTSINGYKFNFLKFFNPDENKGFWQNLIINDSLKIRITDSSMILKYPNKIKTFKVQIVGTQLLTDTVGSYFLKTTNYKLLGDNNNNNIFMVDYHFYGNLFRYKDFINTEFKIKHNAIFWIKKGINYHLIGK